MTSKTGPTQYTHWRRPRTRMYDYNYEYASSYYRPQVSYIGSTVDQQSRKARRRTVSPPGAKTFSERWAANPFYGRYEPISEYPVSRQLRAASVPGLNDLGEDYYGASATRNVRGRSVSRARSVSREQSVYRGESVARARTVTSTRARSTTRARSVSRAASVFENEERAGRSGSYFDDQGAYYDPLSEQEWEQLLKVANRDEREKSIFQLRMALENPRELPKKKMMETTVGHGVYQSTLYGTVTWDPAPYVSGRQ